MKMKKKLCIESNLEKRNSVFPGIGLASKYNLRKPNNNHMLCKCCSNLYGVFCSEFCAENKQSNSQEVKNNTYRM